MYYGALRFFRTACNPIAHKPSSLDDVDIYSVFVKLKGFDETSLSIYFLLLSQSLGSKRADFGHLRSCSYKYGSNAIGQLVGVVYEESGKDKMYKGVVKEFIRAPDDDFSDDDDDGEDLYFVQFDDGDEIYLKPYELEEGYRLLAESSM